MDREQIEKLVEAERQHRHPLASVKAVGHGTILINHHPYRIVTDPYHKFDLSSFSARYCPAFRNYDYLLGDYSYGQLRLTGFYRNSKRVNGDFKVSHVFDYLNEDCNFGAFYYLLQKVGPERSSGRSARWRSKKRR